MNRLTLKKKKRKTNQTSQTLSSDLREVFCSDSVSTNFLLIEREGCNREYWPEFVAVRTVPSKVRTQTKQGQYYPIRLEQSRLISILLCGTQIKPVYFQLSDFREQKYSAYYRFRGNSPHGKNLSQTLGELRTKRFYSTPKLVYFFNWKPT